eukprot:2297995-Amphidinium_carterae.1
MPPLGMETLSSKLAWLSFTEVNVGHKQQAPPRKSKKTYTMTYRVSTQDQLRSNLWLTFLRGLLVPFQEKFDIQLFKSLAFFFATIPAFLKKGSTNIKPCPCVRGCAATPSYGSWAGH